MKEEDVDYFQLVLASIPSHEIKGSNMFISGIILIQLLLDLALIHTLLKRSMITFQLTSLDLARANTDNLNFHYAV